MEEAADGETFVIIEGMLENGVGDTAAVEHEVFADHAAGIGEAVGKLFVGGQQKQAGSLRAVGADYDGFCFLQMRVALLVKVDRASHAAVVVHFDAMDVGVGANFAAAGFFRYADGGGEGAGLCADFAAEGQAEAAIYAGAASGARLGKNGHRSGEGMPAELARGTLENYAGTFHGKRRHGIGLGARRIEGAGAGEARDADFPFDLGVIRLEIGVGDGPIAQIGAGNRADFAALDEIDFVEAPEICGEVHAGAADATTVKDGALGLGFFGGRLAERGGLKFGLVGQQILADDFHFVVDEIGLGQIRTLFQNDDAKAVFGEFLGHDATSGAGADDDEIDFVGSFVFGKIELHALVFSASGGLGCQPA